MGRKKIIDASACKFTFDLYGENKKALDEITENYMQGYGPILNKIIATFCIMPAGVKEAIEHTCLEEYDAITKALDSIEEAYHRQPLEKQRETYEEILKLINRGFYEFSEEEQAMKKIRLENGYLVIPNDWIVLNPEETGEQNYAAVVECRNSAKYDIPHFVYLTNVSNKEDYNKTTCEQILTKCREVWPRFKEIEKINEKNALVPDPEQKGKYLNREAYLNSPLVGIFHIEEQGENPSGNSTYGAMIVRNTFNE